MIVKSGIPEVLAAGSVELGEAIAEITPGSIGVTNVLNNVLSNFSDGAVIVIDPHTGKIYAASPEAKRTALINAVADDLPKVFLDPDAGQTGRSLKWTKNEDSDGSIDDEETLTDAVKPSFTVESLVGRLLSLMQAAEAATPAKAGNQFIVIDQVNKRVTAHSGTVGGAGIRTALDAIALNVADTEEVSVQLTPEAGESSPSSLPFEGGAV